MSLAEELAGKYGFTNQGYERSDFVAALKELQERCAKEAECSAGCDQQNCHGFIAARIRSL